MATLSVAFTWGDSLDIRDYLRILRKSWLLILSMTVLGLVISGTVSVMQQPEYAATAKVFVSTETTGTVG